MKQIIQEYKEQIKYFLSSKRYVIIVVLVSVLSYGFAVTHYTIGVDDLCFDRYVHGTYILSAKRWGTWLLYNLFQINEFSPFWLDAVTAIFMVTIAIVLSAFIRKQYGNKIKIWGYVIFSSLLISNPIIGWFFTYQATNVAITISNLMVILCAITIFENYFGANKKIVNVIAGLILTIPISMYESCAQTYLVVLFVSMFIKSSQGKEIDKKIFKYFCVSIAMLLIGIVMYFTLGKLLIVLLKNFNILTENFAEMEFTIFNKDIQKVFLIETMREKLINGMQQCIVLILKYFPAEVLIVLSMVTILSEIMILIKTRKVTRVLSVLGAIFANFILLVIFLMKIMMRIQFSWIVTTAFLSIYVYHIFCDKKIIKYIVVIAAILLIIIQTRLLNQYFYSDYKRYEKEKIIANDIAINVMKNCEYRDKPLYYIADKSKENQYKMPGGTLKYQYVLLWGLQAFKETYTETTKFINDQGYNFKYITKEEAKKAEKLYKKLDEESKKEPIIEFEDVIIVNLDVYEF